jgi:archaellum biogenesis protein FlaJ (TadC family)
MDFLGVSIAIFLAILIAAGTNISIFRPSTFRRLRQKDQEKTTRYIKICIYSTVSGFFISILAFFLRYAEVSQLGIILSLPMLICLLLSGFTLGMLLLLTKQGEQ